MASFNFSSLPMPKFGEKIEEIPIKKCQGGPIPGVNDCDDEVHMDGMCEFHYEEFQLQEKQRKLQEEKKRKEEEKKQKQKEARADKFKDGVTVVSFCDERGELGGFECTVDICDKLAADIFIQLMTDAKGNQLIKRDGGNLCIFDSKTGVWKIDDDSVKKVISLSKLKLYKLAKDEEGNYVRAKKCSDYSGTLSNVNKLVEWLHFHLDDEKFISSNIHSNVGKVLFDDGIYDFHTDTFTPEFDPNIVFFHRMGRKFPQRNEKNIDWVEKTLFSNLFENQEVTNFFKANVAWAISGELWKMRKAIFCQGETASGKGMIEGALKKLFPGIVQSFDSNNLVFSKSTKDEAQKLMWLINLKTCRMAISSEFQIEKDKRGNVSTFINSGTFKKIVSGGDTIEVRGMHANVEEMVNRAALFLMFNDCPQFFPMDKAVEDRVENIQFSKSFVMNPTLPGQVKRDPTIKDKVLETEYLEALFFVIVDSYKNLCKGKIYTSAPKEIIEEEKNDVTEATLQSVLREHYDFVLEPTTFEGDKNPQWKVTNKEINQLIFDKLGIVGIPKIQSEFKKLRFLEPKFKFETISRNGIGYRGNLVKKVIL